MIRRIIALCALASVAACEPASPTDVPDPPESPQGLLRGVGLSPRGFPVSYSQLEAFLTEVEGMGRSAVMWNGGWRDDLENGSDAGEIPVGAQLIGNESENSSRFAPVAVFGWRSGETLFVRVPGNATNDWRNMEARAAYAEATRSYASTYKPALLFLGNESDFYAAADPGDYVRWVAAYNQAYDAIKAVSPGTQVGPVFNVEHMMGWGVFSGWTTPHTGAFTLHDRQRVDVVGLTLYPYLGLTTPAQLEADHLDPVFQLLGDIPVAITETGWPASGTPGTVPWEAGEDLQVDYLNKLGQMLDGRDVLLVNWLFLHPLADGSQDILSTFGTVSLRNQSGGKRPVYDPFVSFGEGE